jgi:hypothetical protein
LDVFGHGPAAAKLGQDITKLLQNNTDFIPMGQTVQQVKLTAEKMSGPFALDDDLHPTRGVTRTSPLHKFDK